MPAAYVGTGGVLAASSFSFNVGTAGTNRLVTIHVGVEQGSTSSISAITVDGKSCTLIHDIVNTLGAGNAQQMWYIDEAALGASAGSVTIAITGTVTATHIQAMLHTGVAGGAPHDSGFDNTSGAISTVTVNGIDCPANGLVVAGWGQGFGAPGSIASITSPHTQRFIEAPSSATLAGSSGVESSQQTNKTYVLTWNESNQYRGTGIVATWPEAAAASGQTHQMML